MSQNPEVPPCPCCGAEDIYYAQCDKDRKTDGEIQCLCCGLHLVEDYAEDEPGAALKKWSRRTSAAVDILVTEPILPSSPWKGLGPRRFFKHLLWHYLHPWAYVRANLWAYRDTILDRLKAAGFEPGNALLKARLNDPKLPEWRHDRSPQ